MSGVRMNNLSQGKKVQRAIFLVLDIVFLHFQCLTKSFKTNVLIRNSQQTRHSLVTTRELFVSRFRPKNKNFSFRKESIVKEVI